MTGISLGCPRCICFIPGEAYKDLQGKTRSLSVFLTTKRTKDTKKEREYGIEGVMNMD
jgi:hypothetical protein